jgi:aspartate-semialdehyde dehydrogenase
MTRIFAAAFVATMVAASGANAASMVETALKLQAAKAALQKLPKAQQAMIWAQIRKKQACGPRFIRGADGKCHPLFH